MRSVAPSYTLLIEKMIRADMKEIDDVKQMSIIGKIHSMRWLKSNSQVSGHTKSVQDGKSTDIKVSDVKSEINEAVRPDIEILSAGLFSDNLKIRQNIDPATKLSTDQSSSFVNTEVESALTITGLEQKSMEAVWNEDINVPNALFPNAQSLVVNKQDEGQMLTMAVADNLVTAHLEQFRFGDEEKKSVESSPNESNNWSSVCRNLPASTASDAGSQRNSKQCHDNNNNNAKSKTESEVRKATQKAAPKVITKKLCEQKPKKRIGTSLKEHCSSSEPNTREKSDSVNLNNNNNNTSESVTELDKSSSQITPKIIDKCSRVDSYNNKHLFMGRSSRIKEQELLKHYKNNAGEEPEDKAKLTAVKAKSLKPETDKRYNGSDDLRKCQKAQVTRTQSYNVQYSRSKPLVKSQQQRYVRTVTKSDQESPRKHISSSNVTASNASSENRLKHTAARVPFSRVASNRPNDQTNDTGRICKEQNAMNRETHDDYNNESGAIDRSPRKSFDTQQSAGSEQNSIASLNSTMQKVTLRNSVLNAKSNNEKTLKGEQEAAHRIKKDTNLFRRSSDFIESKHSNAKPIDQKTHNCPSDVNARVQIESTKIATNPAKAVASTHKTNKTETSSSAKIAVHLTKFGDTCSNKSSAAVTDGAVQKHDPSKMEKISSVSDVRSIVKAAQEECNNGNSNNRSGCGNVEIKSVKFADSVEEINSNDYPAMSYFNKSAQSNKLPVNSLLSEHSMMHQMEQQSMQNKNYFENNTQYNAAPSLNHRGSEQDLQMMDAFQQKANHIMHSPPNIMPTGNPAMVMGNEMLQYQNMSMYLNQYNNMHAARKTPDSTNTVQTAQIPGAMPFNNGNQTLLQNDAAGVLMHNNQSSIVPPPGFRNHSMIQPDQWNLSMPEMFYFGNMVNAPHPMNMPVQNTRPICAGDFNNMQQLGYLQQPLFYVPPMCPQNWNSLLQYPTPLLQSPQYPACATFPSQVMPSSNLADTVNCHVPTSMQNNPYRHLNQIPQADNNPANPGTMKFECYAGNPQGCMKLNNSKAKEPAYDSEVKGVHYHRQAVPNEYQNCSQDAQLMTPFSYPIALDALARNGQSNIQMHAQQKYQPQRNVNINHHRPSEVPSSYQGSQDYNSRKDHEMFKNETECIPSMVSPRECMYYGIGYPKKPENIPNSIRSDAKPAGYSHCGASSYVIPQYQKNGNYQMPSKDIGSRPTIARGIRKTMEP